MRLIDADKLLESMSKRYDEKKDIVPDNLAEGFMQMDKLIHEQDAFCLEAHDKIAYEQGRADAIDECYMKAKTMMDELRYHHSNKRAGKTHTLYCLQALNYLRQVAEQLKEQK